MKAVDVAVELEWLNSLPGRKVLIKGNHDYWWPGSHKKLGEMLPEGIYAIKKRAVVVDGVPIIGVRGGDFLPWVAPGEELGLRKPSKRPSPPCGRSAGSSCSRSTTWPASTRGTSGRSLSSTILPTGSALARVSLPGSSSRAAAAIVSSGIFIPARSGRRSSRATRAV